MDERYAHPEVTRLWSREWTYKAWLTILTETLEAQRRHRIVDPDDTQELLRAMRFMESQDRSRESLARIAEIEEQTKHDVVAFLQWLRIKLRTHGIPHNSERWVHFGLTSSDLVDTAQGLRFHLAHNRLNGMLLNLASEFTAWTLDETPILARTHGQPAEPMTMRARAMHWTTLVSTPASKLAADTRRMRVGKLSGPVGTYAHNPLAVEIDVMEALGLSPMGSGASQIIPRSALSAWANSAAELAAALAKVATDIRLMNILGEAQESFTEGQVGSSSMAHKRNPIKAERICGMARVARGYAAMLMDQDLWLERDISNSSVERIAVPDLWHTTLFMIGEMIELLRGLHLNKDITYSNLAGAGNAPLVSATTLDQIRAGASAEEARRYAQQTPGAVVVPQTVGYYMRNYPEDRSERN